MLNSFGRFIVLVVAIGLFGTGSYIRADTIVANGGFEVPSAGGSFITIPEGSSQLTGWVISKSSVYLSAPDPTSIDHIGGYWDPAEGNQSIDLDGSPRADDQSATVSQDLSLVAGKRYELSFALAGNPDGLPTLKTVLVTVGDLSQVVTFDAAGKTRHISDAPPGMGWIYHSFLFTAGATNTLSFDSSTPGWYGPALDDVSVVAVPLPTTASMGIVLLGCMGVFGAIRRIKMMNQHALV